jgi:hypothetical protein
MRYFVVINNVKQTPDEAKDSSKFEIINKATLFLEVTT